MKKSLLLLFVFTMFLGVSLFAQYIQVTPRDILTPWTTGARLLAENPTYTSLPTADRWLVQLYKDGGDNVISPLDGSGNPTGDDIMVTDALNSNATQYATITLSGGNPYVTLLAIKFYAGTSQANQGDKVYLRIFNAHTIGMATKAMTSVNLYTVPAAPANVEMDNILGWSANFVPFFIPTGYAFTVQSNYPGATILLNGSPTGQVTPYTFAAPAATGIYSVSLADVTSWTPATFEFTGQSEQTIRFMGVKVPGAAINPNPYNGYIFHIAYDATATPYILTWEGPNGLVASGYHIYWQGGFVIDVTTPTWTTPAIAEGNYTWKVVPYITDPAKGTTRDLQPVRTKITGSSPKGDATTAVDWAFTIVRDADPALTPALVWPANGYTDIPYANCPIYWEDADFPGGTFELYLDTNALPTTLINEASELVTSGTHVYHRVYMALAPNTHYFWFVRHFDGLGKGSADSPIWNFWTGDNPLPVTLSSFTAVYNVGYFVQLTWMVQSETNHLGYNILRNTEENLENAVTLNSTPISGGSSQGTQLTYNFRDDQVETNQNYYYWLESIDLSGTSQFFGPINVVTTGGNPEDPTPEIPVVTSLMNAYPNPFSSMSSLPYFLKTAADVKVEVFNTKGKMVKSFYAANKEAGLHRFTWDGRDTNGKSLSSGIYYYRMTSGKYTASKKIVLVK